MSFCVLASSSDGCLVCILTTPNWKLLYLD